MGARVKAGPAGPAPKPLRALTPADVAAARGCDPAGYLTAFRAALDVVRAATGRPDAVAARRLVSDYLDGLVTA